jgi:acyl-CoA synthetase (AMP-forming)/AMP-acid ligase II
MTSIGKANDMLAGLTSNKHFLSELLQTVAARGRALLAHGRERLAGREARTATLVELCEALLSGRGEASGVARAQEILAAYSEFKTGERIAFFEALARTFGIDRERLKFACAAFERDPSDENAAEVAEAAEPRRQMLIRRLNLAPEGTGSLVAMRAQLLDVIERRGDLAAIDRDFLHLLGSWFNRGFLVLRRIDWSTPANILEKIIRYEAVHEIHDWDDLRARIDSPDRRCYAFFHPALPDDPLIFVEVALTREIPDAITPILERKRTPLDPQDATTAAFYSISNTQRGLAGVSFGSFLIKQVVEEISRELPRLSTFVTLSPVPGFSDWLARERKAAASEISPADKAVLAHLDDANWPREAAKVAALKPVLVPLAAHYLLSARTKSGRPIDPVARFHLGNGARLERINFAADLSPRALAQSAGIMVNYRYDLDEIEKNHEAYAAGDEIAVSPAVRRLLRRNGHEPRRNRSMRDDVPIMTNHLFGAIEAAIPGRDRTLIELANGARVSYGEVFALVARLAGHLARRGVVPGDRVAVQVEKSWQALALYLACLRAGAVYLPLNTAYPLAELEYFLADSEPKLVVCRPENEVGVLALAGKLGIPAIETLGVNGDGSLVTAAADAPVTPAATRGPDDLAAILYTSGTTGRSKGAMLTHDNLLSNALVLKDYWRFSERDVLLHTLPIFHTHGLFVACNVVLAAGASMVFLPKFDAAEVLRLMPRATAMMGVPTFYVRLLETPELTRESAAHMRVFISGSAPLLAETHRAFAARTGQAIVERYGMTETNMNTSNPYDGERIAGTVGFPLPGVSLRVADQESGQPLAQGELGVLEVKGPNVFKGYWRNPEKTRAEFRDGYFITGDLGRIDARGYVHIVGRAKDLVITGGYNVYPKEVEVEIDVIPGVVESAVIGVPHPDFGEGVTAVVVRAAESNLCEADVLSALADRLAKFKQPKRVFFVEELPRNAMGKVQKNVLRETYAQTFARGAA